MSKDFRPVFTPDGPGEYTTRMGKIAVITARIWDTQWMGYIEGELIHCFWKPTGKHGVYRSYDIVGRYKHES